MKRCPKCRSFVPASVCSECDHVVGPKGRGVLGSLLNVLVFVSGSSVVTLAACTLPSPGPEPGVFRYCDTPEMDLDGDGYCGEYDCDESDPDRHVDAIDSEGDGVDQNCDGVDGVFAGSDAGPTR